MINFLIKINYAEETMTSHYSGGKISFLYKGLKLNVLYPKDSNINSFNSFRDIRYF